MIVLQVGLRSVLMGDDLPVTVRWTLEHPDDSGRLLARLVWTSRDFDAADQHAACQVEIPEHQLTTESVDGAIVHVAQPVLRVPGSGPPSFQGRLVHIRWQVEVAAPDSLSASDEASAPITVMHHGQGDSSSPDERSPDQNGPDPGTPIRAT